MKKFIITALIIVLALTNVKASGKPKKVKCKKPIYFFENVKKDVLFDEMDKAVQMQKYELEKMYPELGFISVKYSHKKEAEPVSLLIKQFGNDAYLFININKNATSLEKNIYASLKKLSKNSYLMNDDMFCKQLTKDAESIHERKKVLFQDTQYNPDMYTIDMKRYVGYDKKTYHWENFKDKFKRKAKDKAKKEAKKKAKEKI